MRRNLLFSLTPLLAVLLFAPCVLRADTIGPTWSITATGTFVIPQETFSFNLVLTYIAGPVAQSVLPELNGTVSFTGPLGTFSETLSNATYPYINNYLGVSTNTHDEIDFDLLPVPSTGSTWWYLTSQMTIAPSVGVPYYYSCFSGNPCSAFTPFTGQGIFWRGPGTTIVERVGRVQTPEPSSLVLLGCGLALLLRRANLAASR